MSELLINPYVFVAAPDLAFFESREDGTDLTTYTFTGVGFGAAAADRVAVVNIAGRMATGASTISSVTIGGVPASVVASAADSNAVAAIYSAALPTGTTATVVVTFGSTQQRCGIGSYALTNYNSSTPHHTATDTTPSGHVNSVSLNIPTNGVALGSYQFVGGTTDPASVAWSGLTEDYDAQLEVVQVLHSGASETGMAQETGRTVTTTASGPTVVANAVLAAASWS